MAEYQEVAKTYDRLCESYDECYKCPMFRNRDKNDPIACRYWALLVNPKKAEKIIMTWAKEHPVKTNADKFKEIFGDEPYTITLFDDNFIRWLREEYKEPIKED